MRTLLKRVYTIIEPAYKDDLKSKIFDIFIMSLIVLNLIMVILESYETLEIKYEQFFKIFEACSVIIFTIEYILRLITADFKYPQYNALKSTIKYAKTPMALIDLLAILPFYLEIVFVDLRFLRLFRLTRLNRFLRVIKFNRYTNSMKLLWVVIKKKKEELILTIFITSLMLLVASSIMYELENIKQPDKFSNIIESLWWAIATLTTVGYGDVYPETGSGKVLSGIIALLGIGLVALPTGIISSSFMEEFNNRGDKNVVNPRHTHRRKKYKRKNIRLSKRGRRG